MSAVNDTVAPDPSGRDDSISPSKAEIAHNDLRSAKSMGLAQSEVGSPRRPRPVLDNVAVRYGLAVASVTAAVLAMVNVQGLAEKPLAFPFYASVVVSAWLGAGPGIVAVGLSMLAVGISWTGPARGLQVDASDLPWFLSFGLCMFMSFAWSWQRRRAQSGLETIVRERTADLLRTNAALQSEMAEREAAQRQRDLTERALREAEAELTRTLRLATMAELAATIAHEINQPLAAITANGSACVRSLMRDPPLLETAREAAGCIVADGHRAGDVIARVRALFNKEQPNKQLLSIDGIVNQVLELSRSAIERQRVMVRTRFAAPLAMVMADPVQLQQVLVNLVTNALEAMTAQKGRPRVLTVRSTMEGGNMVGVAIEDTGTGLQPDQVGRIFDSFYTTKPGGIGLGLSISHSIVEAHGGAMWATPRPEGGACFGFALPRCSAEQQGHEPLPPKGSERLS